MEKVLSMYFSPTRTYITLLEKANKGLKLLDLSTTSLPIDLENLENPTNEQALEELYTTIKDISNDAKFISISIPMEYLIITQFPGRPQLSRDEIMTVLDFEIKHNYPQFNPEDFPTFLFELQPRKERIHFLAAIIPKKIFQTIKSIAKQCNKTVQRIEISQISAQNCFLYNYPEERDNFVGLFNLSDNFIDYSVIKGEEFYSYNLIKYNSEEDIPKLIEQNVNKINNEFSIEINSLYLFGTNLNKIILNNLTRQFKNKLIKIKRLNAFRLVANGMEESSKQICARLAHHYPACVGCVLPEYHKKVKFY